MDRPRAAIYARISSDPEDRRRGIDRHVQLARAIGRTHGLTVPTSLVFKDNDVSATTFPLAERPAGRKLVAAIEAGEVQVVLASEASRVFRSAQDRLDVMQLLRRIRGKIITQKEGVQDPNTSSGRLLMNLLGDVAAHEAELKSERTRDRHLELAEGGWWKGGPRPFGYRDVRVRHTDGKEYPSLEIVPKEAEAIRDAAGRLLDGEGLRTICRRWNAAGLRTPQRRRDGNGSRKNGGKEWASGSLRGVLTSPVIAGIREHNVYEPDPDDEDPGADGRKHRRRRLVSSEQYQGKWAPILDKKTWNRLVTEFEARAADLKERGVLPNNRRYLLTGLVVCANCGDPMIGKREHRKRAYSCQSSKSHRKGGRGHVGAEPLEEFVLGRAAGRQVDTTKVRDPETVAPELRVELDEIEERLTAWAREAALAGLTAAEIREGRKPLADRRDELEAQIAERASATASRFEDLRAYAEASDPMTAFTDDPETRAWLETLIDRIEVKPVGNSKWVPAEKRATIRWRKGVRAVA